MNLLDLFVRIGVDDEASSQVSKIGNKIKSGLATAGKIGAAGIGLITAAAGAAVGGLLALEGATEEYRVAQGKLNTAFDAAGLSADAARESYYAFYGILGDTDTATEASQLLAKLVENEEDIVYWTDIAAGVYGTFGDSLPIEGLIEASNETAKVGTVTGVLADALNWAGINEDEFNEKLAACTSESERNRLIMETLTATYDEAASAFYQNNQTLVQSRDAQTMLMDAMSKLGQTVSEVKTKLMGEFVPALAKVTTAFSDMLTGVEGADKEFSDAVGELVNAGVSKLPEFLAFGAQILASIASGIVGSIPALIQSIPQVLQSFAASFSASLPSIRSTGAQLVSTIGEGITTSLPTLMQSGLEAAAAFSASLRENAGLVIDGALSLAKSLAQGLADSLPTIIENVPEIVTNIAGVINDNAPKILATGVQIVVTLVKGIINAIPTIIENIPQIINAIVNVILAFNWLNLGKTIITGLGNGIKAMISAIKDIASQVVEAIKGGISALPQAMLNIGKNIIQGLWNGIQSMVGWIKDKVSGFVGGLVGGVKDLLGIHSPSTVFMTIGQYMMNGLYIGLISWSGEVLESVDDIINEIKTRFTTLSDLFTTRQDISELEYQLWEGGEGRNATEAEKYAKKLELLNEQQQQQQSLVEAAVAAYESVVTQYGENAQESYEYQKTLLKEQLELQNLQNEIYDTIAAMQVLAAAEGNVGSVSFENSGIGVASNASINATQEAIKLANNGGEFSFNLVLPTGEKLASYFFNPLVSYAKANGTPIVNPTG